MKSESRHGAPEVIREDNANFARVGEIRAESLIKLYRRIREKFPRAVITIGPIGDEEGGILAWDDGGNFDASANILAAIVMDK